MFAKLVGVNVLLALLILRGPLEAGQKPARRTGTLIGELKSQKPTKDGKNSIIEVLAPGEERARSYHVVYDAKIKGPIPAVLKAVRAAEVGDVVKLNWIETGHGPAIQAFEVFRKKRDR